MIRFREQRGCRAIGRQWALLTAGVLAVAVWCCPALVHAEKDHVTAVVLADFPPLYVTLDNGRADGFALDSLKAVAEDAGLTYDLLVVKNWGEAMEAVRSGRADVIPGIGNSEARRREFLFTDVFETIPVSCFVRSDTHDIQSIADLKGRSTGVINRSAAHTKLAPVPGMRLVPFHSIDEALFGLLAGKVDAFVFPEPVLWKKMRTIDMTGKVKVVGKPLMELQRGYLLRKDDRRLADRLSASLKKYVASPLFRESYLKWWGKPEPFWTPVRMAAVGGSALLVTVGLLLMWRYYSVTILNRKLAQTMDQRLEAQKQLEASEQRLIRAQEIAIIGSFERNIATGEGYWSEGLFKLLGLPVAEKAIPVDDFFAMIHPDDLPVYRRGGHGATPGSPDYSLEFRFKPHGQDEYRHAACRYTFEFSDDGKPVKRVGTIQDITDRKRIEAELNRAKEKAEEANRSKSEFLANMSHELRTPLNGAMGMLQLMSMDELSGEHRECVEIALTSCKSLTQLLGDILDLSKVEAGRLELRHEQFSPKGLLDSVRETFSRSAKEKGVELAFRTSPDTPERLVGDCARLRQVLFNIVGNALKFTESGSVLVEASPVAFESSRACRMLFSVTDTGIGIPDEKLNDIFGAFTQVDGAHTRKYQGTGLGLHIVKRLADLMDGHLSVESLSGEGTTMHFSVVFGIENASSDQGIGQEETAEKPTDSLRILVAEDERINRIAVCRLVERLNHEVDWASNGEEVLDRLVEGDIDLILMDIQMPVLNGLEATHRIRNADSLGHKRNIPIVALTAHAMSGDREQFIREGMDDYLSKPVNIDDLKSILDRFTLS